MTSWPWCPSITQSNVFANRNICLDSQWFNKLFFLHRVYWFLLLVRAKDCIVRVGVLQCLHPFFMYTLLYFPLYDFHHPLLPQICFLSSLCPEASHFLFIHALINVFINSAFLYFTVAWLLYKVLFWENPWDLGLIFFFFLQLSLISTSPFIFGNSKYFILMSFLIPFFQASKVFFNSC